MWSVSSVATAPGSMTITRMSGWSSWRRASDQPFDAPLGRGVARVARASFASGDRRDVHEIAATVAELVEEHLGGGHRAEQVGLDHLPVLGALAGRERPEQHHAGVVDEDVRAAQLLLDALGGRDDGVAVGDVGLDGQRTVAELAGERPDAVGAAREERETVAVGGEGARGGLADPGGGAGDDRDAAGVLIGAQEVSPVVFVRGASVSVVDRAWAFVTLSTMFPG